MCRLKRFITIIVLIVISSLFLTSFVYAEDVKGEEQFKINVDTRGGTGLRCYPNDEGWDYDNKTGCFNYYNKDEMMKFPRESTYLWDSGTEFLYGFLGWTNVKDPNGVPVCATYNNGESSFISADTSIQVIKDDTYYACYYDEVNAVRYAQDNPTSDGLSVPCGASLFITKCFQVDHVNYCQYTMVNGEPKTGHVYRDKIVKEKSEVSNCPEQSSSNSSSIVTTPEAQTSEISTDVINANFIVSDGAYVSGVAPKCGDTIYVTSCDKSDNGNCTFDSINGVKADGTVKKNYIKKNKTEIVCSTNNKSDSCTNTKQSGVTGTVSVNVCYNKSSSGKVTIGNKEAIELVSCKNEYKISNYEKNGNETCSSINKGSCYFQYDVTCSNENGFKPVLEVSAGDVSSDGYGFIKVKAITSDGSLIKGIYYSDVYQAPTASSDWNTGVTNNNFSIKSTPGIKYIWVMDADGNISETYRGAVLDTVNKDTTVKTLRLVNSIGQDQSVNAVAYQSSGISSSDYVRLSNKLIDNSKLANAAFNPYTTEYNMDVESPTVTVYATLTSSDASYVEGYEPRTVNLKYGANTILIKIKNKQGKIRTYTIIVNRKDDRTSDNTLNDLKVSVGSLKFNSNVTEYKVTIPGSTKSVDVSSTILSETSSYVSGYEPGKVEIKDNVTTKLIKVRSQTGTTRTYVITLVKDGSDIVNDKTLMLEDLTISKLKLPFESEVLNYSMSVGYESDIININPMLKNSDSKYTVYVKRFGENDFVVSSNRQIPLNVGENFIKITVINSLGKESTYNITIVRKEFGLEVSNDSSLKDLTIMGHDIKFAANKRDYIVKIKTEKSLVITAVPNSNRAEVLIYGNEELTGFSTIRIKVLAENGDFQVYSVDINKDLFNKAIEIGALIVAGVIILMTSGILIIKKKNRNKKEYYEE